MHVEIYTLSPDGENILDGALCLVDGVIVAEPNSPLLQGILAEPIYDPRAGRVWDAVDNPLEFLRTMAGQYRGAYLRASEVKEDEEEIHP